MNYQLINFAELYYQLNGFKKVTVPWTVSQEISCLTKPPKRQDFFVKDKVLVGSAEQSFLEEHFSGKLKSGKYLATTPCFRDEEKLDDLHHQYFLKTELIQIGKVSPQALEEIINISVGFFNQFIPVKVVNLPDGTFDINSANTNIELGSYGIRKYSLGGKSIEYIYATGCALPRLSQVIEKEKKMGYHQNLDIPKTSVGSILKVFEEVHELQDAVLQGQRLLILCELADILGAIDHYLDNNHPELCLEDIYSMSRLTRRAFSSGSR